MASRVLGKVNASEALGYGFVEDVGESLDLASCSILESVGGLWKEPC